MLASDKQVRRKRNMKCLAYIVVVIVFQIIVFVALGLTVLRVRSPNIKIDSATILSSNFNTASPSFNMTINAAVAIKNKNWGEYKFNNSTMSLSYEGVTVGEAQILAGKAKARRTRRLNVNVEVSSDAVSGNSKLRNDLNSGTLTLSSYTKMRGKVKLVHLMKRNKSGEMNCTIIIDTKNRKIQNVNCK